MVHEYRDLVPQRQETKEHSFMPRSLPAATPFKVRGKSKGNRSIRCIPGGNEAIWDEELHAALIEALTIYPPMGRQRIRPVHDGGASHTSLGRCQLIQQYLMQKTGKNRTRKQISSRIQRLRHMHQDDPAMADSLRVLPDFQQPIAPEMLLSLDDCKEIILPTSPVPATPPWLGSVESSANSSPSANLLGGSCYSSSSSSSIQSNQLVHRLFESADFQLSNLGDAGNEVPDTRRGEQRNVWPGPRLHLPDRPAPQRRISPEIPGLYFQLDPRVPPFSFPGSGYGFDASTTPVEAESLGLAGNQFPYLNCHGHTTEPITPIDQIIHTPEFPPQVLRCDKRSVYESRCAEKDAAFFQPAACASSLGPYDPQAGSHLFATAEYGSSKPSPFQASRAQNYSFPSSPLASYHASVQSASPGLMVPLDPEVCQGQPQIQDFTHMAHFPRRLSYPCDSRLLDLGPSLRASSVAYSYVSEEGNIGSTLGGLDLAPPAVIRPFFIPNFPCSASGSSPSIPLAELASASVPASQ